MILRHPMAPALQSALVMTVMTIASVPIMLRDRIAKKASTRDWLWMAWLGIADALNVLTFFAAYQRTSVAIAVLTHYLTPIFIALAAPFLLGEKLGPRTIGAVAVSFAGLFLLLAPWRSELGAADLLGAGLGAASAVFYASDVIANKRINTVFSAAEIMVYHGLVGTPLLWLFVPAGAITSASVQALVTVLVGALVVGTFCGLAFTWGLQRIRASHASVLTLLEPFVAVVMAAAFLHQPLGLASVLGGLLILGGAVAVVVQSEST